MANTNWYIWKPNQAKPQPPEVPRMVKNIPKNLWFLSDPQTNPSHKGRDYSKSVRVEEVTYIKFAQSLNLGQLSQSETGFFKVHITRWWFRKWFKVIQEITSDLNSNKREPVPSRHLCILSALPPPPYHLPPQSNSLDTTLTVNHI